MARSNCLPSIGDSRVVKLSACARCGLVRYCSRECQRAHWKDNHEQYCIPKADRVPQQQKALDATSEAAATAGECAICLDPLTDASACTLRCSHVFPASCVEELRNVGVTQTCPLCRTALPLGPEKLYDDGARRYLLVARLVEQGTRHGFRFHHTRSTI